MATGKWYCFIGVGLMMTCLGCQITGTEGYYANSSGYSSGANGVSLVLHKYVGTFGDDTPNWGGTFYSRQNLSIVAHLPSKSEFIICVRSPASKGSDYTNSLRSILEPITTTGTTQETKEQWIRLTQKIDTRKQSGQQKEVLYLKSEFDGMRVDTDRYQKSDQVHTVVLVGCLTPEKEASKSLYSLAIAMIPLDVPDVERKRLLKVLDDFLRYKITYLL